MMTNLKNFQYKNWERVRKVVGVILVVTIVLLMLHDVSSNQPSHIALETISTNKEVYMYNKSNVPNNIKTQNKNKLKLGMALEDSNTSKIKDNIKSDKTSIPEILNKGVTGDINVNLHNNKSPKSNLLENDSYDNEKEKPKVVYYKLNKVGYVTTTLNVREEPNTESNVIRIFPTNRKVKYSYYDDNWVVTKYNDEYVYLYKKYISNKPVKVKEKSNYKTKTVNGDKRKSYMDYRCITSRSSKQYKLQNEYAHTSSNGIRVVNGRYCIALGSYYTHKVGQLVDLILSNGTVIQCIIGDCKADKDTSSNNSLGHDGGVAEFIVDTRSLPTMVKRMGDVSYTKDSWKSNVVKIKIYNKSLF